MIPTTHKDPPMERIGEHIVEIQTLTQQILNPAPDWLPGWQLEAEHVLFLAHKAANSQDYDRLRMLDGEAKRLVEVRRGLIGTN